MDSQSKQAAIDCLNTLLEIELAGVVRYTHYSLMVFGYNRIPIVSWLRAQAQESLGHAHEVGELITLYEGHPSLSIGNLLETHQHTIGDILIESLEHERRAVAAYHKLLQVAEGNSVMLEEFARKMISAEEMHLSEVEKMLRKPGEIKNNENV